MLQLRVSALTLTSLLNARLRCMITPIHFSWRFNKRLKLKVSNVKFLILPLNLTIVFFDSESSYSSCFSCLSQKAWSNHELSFSPTPTSNLSGNSICSIFEIYPYALHSPSSHYSKQWSPLSLLQRPPTGLPASLSPPAICYSLSSLTDASIHKPYHIAAQFKILRSLLLSSVVKLKTIPQPTWFGSCSVWLHPQPSTFILITVLSSHWPLSCLAVTPGILCHRAFAPGMLSVHPACLWEAFMAHAFTSFSLSSVRQEGLFLCT